MGRAELTASPKRRGWGDREVARGRRAPAVALYVGKRFASRCEEPAAAAGTGSLVPGERQELHRAV